MRDRLGVADLWSHQAQALDLVRRGHSVAVATGTASGKSLCYQAAIAEAARRGHRREAPDAPATALLLFPTKALAQDQLRALTELDVPGWWPPPTTATARPRSAPGCGPTPTWCCTNPEMLHHGILPTTPAGPPS